jgi:hypothetical protein
VKLKIAKSRVGTWDVFHLSGGLTEASVEPLLGLLSHPGTKCRFNFRNLQTINSRGLYEWLTFLREFDTGGRQLEFEECGTVVVFQLNMLPTFRLSATVTSVMVDYSCPNCQQTATALVPINDEVRALRGAPPRACERCATAMTPGDSEPYEFV